MTSRSPSRVDQAKLVAIIDTINDLSPYERRELQSRITLNPYKFDIVGNLPLEIVLLIFLYIDDFIYVFRYLNVSKLWKAKLSNFLIRRRTLEPWLHPRDLLFQHPPEDTEEGHARIVHRAAEIHALRKGNYTEVYECEAEHVCLYRERTVLLPMWVRPEYFDFNGFAVAHVLPGSNKARLRLHNLLTNKSRDFSAKDSEPIYGLCLTSRLIGFLSANGICYAADIHTGVLKHSSLPSTEEYHIRGRENRLLVIRRGTHDNTYRSKLWDCDKNSTVERAFISLPELPLPSFQNEEEILLQPDGNSFILFRSVTGARQTELYCTKFDINSGGVVWFRTLELGEPQLLGAGSFYISAVPYTRLEVNPINDYGGFAILSSVNRESINGSVKQQIYRRWVITYDEMQDCFQYQKDRYFGMVSQPEQSKLSLPSQSLGRLSFNEMTMTREGARVVARVGVFEADLERTHDDADERLWGVAVHDYHLLENTQLPATTWRSGIADLIRANHKFLVLMEAVSGLLRPVKIYSFEKPT